MRANDTTQKAALKTGRASVIRSKLNRLGRVWAADRDTAEKLDIEEFHLSDSERKRLIVEEVR